MMMTADFSGVDTTRHWSMHIPKGAFLTVQNLAFQTIAFLVDSEDVEM